MAAKLYNLARMSTATTGTGTITLGAAVSGFLTFALAGVQNGDVVSYGIKDGGNSEVGTGTYTASGTTLTRTVIKSTNADAAISLSGNAEVFITALKADIERTAAEIANTPAGNIVAVTVQAALNELDTEKLAKAGNLSDIASAATALANLAGSSRLAAGGGTIVIDYNLATDFGVRSAHTTAANAPVAEFCTIFTIPYGDNPAGYRQQYAISVNTLKTYSRRQENGTWGAWVQQTDAGGSPLVADNAVGNAKLADMATGHFKGRVTAGTGDPEDLNMTLATAMLNGFTAALKGLVPASGGGSTNFLRADATWQPVTVPLAASVAEQEAETSTTVYTSPGTQRRHPSAAKVWCRFTQAGTQTLEGSYNVSGLTDAGVGVTVVSFSTPFSSNNFSAVSGCEHASGVSNLSWVTVRQHAAGSVTLFCHQGALSPATFDNPDVSLACFGDQ